MGRAILGEIFGPTYLNMPECTVVKKYGEKGL